MDSKKFVGIVMNPVRQRILQYLAIHKSGTPNEIGSALSDIPKASLYRHIRTLANAGFIAVVGEKNVRGALERTYAVCEKPPELPAGNEEIGSVISFSLLSLLSSFAGYFADEASDPVRDMLTLSASTLMLTDSEFTELLQSFAKLIGEYIQREPDGERKPRRLTIISSPTK